MRTITLITIFFLAMSAAFAQGVAINENGNAADPSAILDVSSTDKGVLIPRMTQSERLAISGPASGLLVYQTDETEGFYYYSGTIWFSLQGHLELITESLNTGYRIKGRDPANYGDIGENAVDLSFSNGPNNARGATGTRSKAAGLNTIASGINSTAWGNLTEASGANSSSWGSLTKATGSGATAWGSNTDASGIVATAWGSSTEASADESTAWGFSTTASAEKATAWGQASEASGAISTSWGFFTKTPGLSATAWGAFSDASGESSTAWGASSQASGLRSTAWGNQSLASGDHSTSWGQETESTGDASTAWGKDTKATGDYATAWGNDNRAIGNGSTAWGNKTKSWGAYSIASGNLSEAEGTYSTAIGNSVFAKSFAEVVVGTYNTSYAEESSTGFHYADRLFVIGNGLSTERRDALIVYKTGRIETYSSPNKKAIQFLNSEGGTDQGIINVYNNNEKRTIKIDGDFNAGSPHATIRLYDGVDEDNSKLYLSANWNNTGKSRLVTDQVQITGGADLSENFEVITSEIAPVPGLVVSIDPANAGKLRVASTSYDKTVAGIISGANGVNPGMMMGQSGSIADGDYPIALTGRVYVNASNEAGEIVPGDLLTTSSRPGYAMKVSDYAKAQGAIIGKAMTSIDENGYVLVLVNLQ
jgi:hypothetical protein